MGILLNVVQVTSTLTRPALRAHYYDYYCWFRSTSMIITATAYRRTRPCLDHYCSRGGWSDRGLEARLRLSSINRVVFSVRSVGRHKIFLKSLNFTGKNSTTQFWCCCSTSCQSKQLLTTTMCLYCSSPLARQVWLHLDSLFCDYYYKLLHRWVQPTNGGQLGREARDGLLLPVHPLQQQQRRH